MNYLKTLSLMTAVACHTLTLVFVILQLTNTIDWNWWMVLSPVWIYASLHLIGWIVSAYLVATYPERFKRSMRRAMEAASKKIKQREAERAEAE